jgi:hypothetical protein
VSEGLYLDTARLGRMSSGARRAVHAFTDLIGEEGGSLYSERFLRHGLSACPAPFQDRYPGLTSWSGVGELKSALRGLVGTPSDLPVLLAHRSAVLMRLAARLLFHPCRNVLVTDLGWPGYHYILADVARRTGRTISVVPLRDRILGGRAGADEVVEEVRRRYSVAGCDGLFLPAVSNLGVRLPLEAIVRSVEREHEVRFVVVDGAQDFCHVGADLRAGFCDLYLSGCHKWLGAYHPLGIACYGCRRSVGVIETTLDHLAATGELDDPLLRFSAHLESTRFEPPAETVSVVPLITCRGAVEDETRARVARPWRQRQRLDNLRVAADLVRSTGWEPLLPDPALRSSILLLRAERPAVRGLTPETLRSAFQDSGVALTAYQRGYVRVSIPDRIWADDELGLLEAAF